MAKRRSFSADFKAKVVLEIISGERSRAEACRHYQFKDSVLSCWIRQFLEQASSVFESKQRTRSPERQRIAELERMVGRLTMELELSKKASQLLRLEARPPSSHSFNCRRRLLQNS